MLRFLENRENDNGIELKKVKNTYPIFIPDFAINPLLMWEEEGEYYFKRGVIFWIKQEHESFDIYELEREASFNDICNSLEL